MNLLVLTSTDSAFNSVRPEAQIYISLLKFGYNITVMTQEKSRYASIFKEHGIKVVDVDYNKKISLSLIKKTRAIIKNSSIDIVFATNSRAIPNAIFACMGMDVQLVTYRGTTGGLYRYDPSSYFNALNPRVDGVICVSEAVTKHVKKQVFDNKKVETIHKGHKIEWYNVAPIDLSEFGSGSENFNVAFVANVRPHKGLSYLLEAAKKLAVYKNIHIILIGKNIDQEPYVSLINSSGMSDRIHLTGFRNDVPQIVAACSVLVQASTRKEGLSRVILEALAAATPVIASAIEGNSEIIDDGVNGYIVPIKNSDAIAQRIIELYNAPEILQKLSNNTKDIFENKMSHNLTVDKFNNFFTSIKGI